MLSYHTFSRLLIKILYRPVTAQGPPTQTEHIDYFFLRFIYTDIYTDVYTDIYTDAVCAVNALRLPVVGKQNADSGLA
jgi:hypothetical protein